MESTTTMPSSAAVDISSFTTNRDVSLNVANPRTIHNDKQQQLKYPQHQKPSSPSQQQQQQKFHSTTSPQSIVAKETTSKTLINAISDVESEDTNTALRSAIFGENFCAESASHSETDRSSQNNTNSDNNNDSVAAPQAVVAASLPSISSCNNISSAISSSEIYPCRFIRNLLNDSSASLCPLKSSLDAPSVQPPTPINMNVDSGSHKNRDASSLLIDSSSTPTVKGNPSPNTSNTNCIIKSLISNASSRFLPSSNASNAYSNNALIRKFCKLADGCKKPAVVVNEQLSQQDKSSGVQIKQEHDDAIIESKVQSASSSLVQSPGAANGVNNTNANNFIEQIIRDTVVDDRLAASCQQLRAVPPSCPVSVTNKNYRENFVAIIDSVIANLFQTETLTSKTLHEATRQVQINRLQQQQQQSQQQQQQQHLSTVINRAKPSQASSLDSGVMMMDCGSPTAESVATMTDNAINELIIGQPECQEKEDSSCDRDRNISTSVYQQLIEFELTNDSILKKFQVADDHELSASSSARFDLNSIEKERLEELENAFFPFQLCFSSVSDEQLWKRLKRSFWSKNSKINLEYQRQSLLAATESAINLLIVMTKQLHCFSALGSDDQKVQLRSSVMEIMIVRSFLVNPQRLKNQSVLKVCTKRLRENSITESDKPSLGDKGETSQSCTQKYYDFIHHPSRFLNTLNDVRAKLHDTLTKPELEPCNHHPLMKYIFENSSVDAKYIEDVVLPDLDSEFSKEDSMDESVFGPSPDPYLEPAIELAKKYRYNFLQLAKSIDREWYEDKHIFHLLLVILLFRPVKTLKAEVKKKVREEHLTYVYLLKRYLESKFRSYCTARSHFIRLFDRLEEIQKINDQIVQKLLDYDLICAQNLLENLCVC